MIDDDGQICTVGLLFWHRWVAVCQRAWHKCFIRIWIQKHHSDLICPWTYSSHVGRSLPPPPPPPLSPPPAVPSTQYRNSDIGKIKSGKFCNNHSGTSTLPPTSHTQAHKQKQLPKLTHIYIEMQAIFWGPLDTIQIRAGCIQTSTSHSIKNTWTINKIGCKDNVYNYSVLYVC